MDVNKSDLDAARQAGILTEAQVTQLWAFWQTENNEVASFQFAHILYYLGGLIAISAVTIFVTEAWESLRGLNLLVISILFFILGISLTHFFLKQKLRVPAGLMASFSLSIVPLAVYNAQIMLGFFPQTPFEYVDFHYYINWCWILMEFSTLIAGLIMFYRYRLPFLLFPISVILWYMSMDLYPFLFHYPSFIWSDLAAFSNFSMLFGVLMLTLAVVIDMRDETVNDYAFWLYIFGMMTFWGGLTGHPSSGELGKFIYCMINLVLVIIGAFLNRRVFAVFGAIGILFYLNHLAFDVFENSLSFPVVLVLLGISIIFIAMSFTRVEARLKRLLLPYMPEKIARRINK